MNSKNQLAPRPLYLPCGRTFRTKERKHAVEVMYRIGCGGQGTAFLVNNLDTGKKMVLKIFHSKFVNDDTMKRMEFLVEQRLYKLSQVFKPPRDIVLQDGFVGYVADFAEGNPVDILVEQRQVNLLQGLIASLILAQNFASLHDLAILHGDIRDTNIRIAVHGDGLTISVIDWDNILAPGLPSAPCLGALRYMAPELSIANKENRFISPTLATERYSFAAIFYELIALRHHLAGYDQSAESTHEAICKGKLLHDPEDNPGPILGGYPLAIMNALLLNLFRRAFSLCLSNRPCLHEWIDVLINAMHSIAPCHFCRKPFFVDPAKVVCPYCRQAFPTLKIITPSGKHIVINSSEIPVGREDLGGSKTISRRHVYFRKLGPDVYIQSVGKISTFRKNGKGWQPLDDYKLVPIEHEQCLRIGDVELRLVRCDMAGREV